MKELSFYDWMTIGLMAIGYVYIITKSVHWLLVLLAKRVDRFRFRKSPRQRAINDFYDAFDLGSIKPSERLTVKTGNGLCLRITRENIDG